MVIREARRAAREGNAPRVAMLDAVIERLGSGMTAGEELSLNDVLESSLPLTADRLAEWHRLLPPPSSRSGAPELRLLAAIVVRPKSPG